MTFRFSSRLARPAIVLTAAAAASFCVMAAEPIKETAPEIASPSGVHWKNDPASIAIPGSVAAQRAAAEAQLKAAAGGRPGGKTLTYYGGPIVNSIKVIQVLYGSGTYQPFVQGT